MNLTQRLKCKFDIHDRYFDRATDYDEGGYCRHYPNGDREPLDACTIIDKCVHCGDEVPVYAPITVVERRNIPTDWEDDDE